MTCATVSPGFGMASLTLPALMPPLIRPEVCVNKSRTVTSRSAGTVRPGNGPATVPDGAGATRPSVLSTTAESPCSSGMNFDAGSVSRTFPSSTSIRIATPTTGFVIDMIRKMASFCIGFFVSMSATP